MRLVHTAAVLAILSAAQAAKQAASLDSFIPICSKSDPNLGECVSKAGEKLIPFLVKGIRDYNFPPVDPLKIPFLSLSQSDKPVGLKLNISDTEHTGINALYINSAKIEKNHWELPIKFPRYSITGICDLGGRILLLPIQGHGFCNLTAIDMDLKVIMDVTPIAGKNGKELYKVQKFRIKLTFNKGAFYLEGLFKGNKELGATMNRFLNENAVDVLNEMKPTLENVFSEVYGGLVTRIFNVVPTDQVFKP